MDALNYLAIVRPSEMVVLESTTLELLDKHGFFSVPLVLKIYITGQDLRKK